MKIKQASIDSVHKNPENRSRLFTVYELAKALGLSIQTLNHSTRLSAYNWKDGCMVYIDDVFIGYQQRSHPVNVFYFNSDKEVKLSIAFIKSLIKPIKDIEYLEVI